MVRYLKTNDVECFYSEPQPHTFDSRSPGNGLQDVNEPGMPNVTAILVDGNGNELDRMDTDENGLYLFEGLQPGTYAVKFDIPEEYLFTPPAKASTPITNPVDGSLSYADVTSDVNVETGVTDAVFLGSGKSASHSMNLRPALI